MDYISHHVVRTSTRGKIKCILENIDTGERLLFLSEAGASRFLGRSNAYLRSVRLREEMFVTGPSGECYRIVYPGLCGIDYDIQAVYDAVFNQ